MSIKRILVADDEESIRWVLSKALKKQGYMVDLAEDGSQARALASKNHYDLAVLDIKMPGVQGLDLLKEFRSNAPDMLVIIMTAEATMEHAVSAMKHGAYDYLTKPFDLTALNGIILKAEKAAEVTEQIDQLKEELQDQYSFGRSIIGNSQPMQEVYKTLGRVAGSDVTILVAGESGTGKELIARAIHINSPRLGKPFIALNCAAIPHDLLESELFGHERGAFTGATERKSGKFEQADQGTLFLDEIGDMPLELQAKLLRVLQEKEITRTGGSQTIQVDVRIVAATNQNLIELVKKKLFREDLYYRLNVVPINLPDCVIDVTTSPCWPNFSFREHSRTSASTIWNVLQKPSNSLNRTNGPEMSGNWKTSSKERHYSLPTIFLHLLTSQDSVVERRLSVAKTSHLRRWSSGNYRTLWPR